MREIARSEKMNFVDGGEETQRGFEVFREDDPNYEYTKPVIHMGVHSDDMMGMTAANIGLPRFQISIGFGTGDNALFAAGDSAPDAHKFAQRVVETLKRHWPVETVPQGTGAFPMESCKNGAQGTSEGPNASKAR